MQELARRSYELDLLLGEAGGELLPLLPSQVRVIALGATMRQGISGGCRHAKGFSVDKARASRKCDA